jgi:hypothetical protein
MSFPTFVAYHEHGLGRADKYRVETSREAAIQHATTYGPGRIVVLDESGSLQVWVVEAVITYKATQCNPNVE